jgi:hypothetical protein
VSFAAITLCVAPQRMFIVAVYFVIDSVRKLSDTISSYTSTPPIHIHGVVLSQGQIYLYLRKIACEYEKCTGIAILCVSLVSFAAITLCVASQRVLIVAVYTLVHLDLPTGVLP